MNAPDRAPSEVETAMRWRVGRKVGRTIYLQLGEDPSDDDPLIGVMDTPELAVQAVDAVRGRSRDDTATTLARVYAENTQAASAVAKVCDEYLDRSGALLGEVRRAAREPRFGVGRADRTDR